MIILFFFSLFASSGVLGFIANVIFALTVLKVVFKSSKRIRLSNVSLALFVYLVFVFISTINSTAVASSFSGMLKTMTYIGFYFSSVVFLKDNTEKLPVFFILISFLLLYENCVAIIQKFMQVRQIATWQDVSGLNPEEILTRVYGTLKPYNPNLFAAYLLLASSMPLGVCLKYLSENNKKFGFIFLFIYLFSSFTIVQTGCRGAYIGLFFSFIIIFVSMMKICKQEQFKQKLKVFFMWLSTFIFLAICFIPALSKRVISIFTLRADSSTSFRLNVIKSSFEMFKDNFLFGIGVGNKTFQQVYGLYMKSGFDALSAYNIFLEVAVESGIFALVAFCTVLFAILKKGFDFVFKTQVSIREFPSDLIFVFVSCIAILSAILHGVVDTVFFRPQVQFLFWFFASVISVFAKKRPFVLNTRKVEN